MGPRERRTDPHGGMAFSQHQHLSCAEQVSWWLLRCDADIIFLSLRNAGKDGGPDPTRAQATASRGGSATRRLSLVHPSHLSPGLSLSCAPFTAACPSSCFPFQNLMCLRTRDVSHSQENVCSAVARAPPRQPADGRAPAPTRAPAMTGSVMESKGSSYCLTPRAGKVSLGKVSLLFPQRHRRKMERQPRQKPETRSQA